MANVSFNPALTTNPQNTFLLQTNGVVQGVSLDDPVSFEHFGSGVIASSVAQPVWGGLAVTAVTPTLGNFNGNNPVLTLPVSGGTIEGFTTFDRTPNMIQIPGNTAPSVQAGANIGYYRLGVKARLPLPISGTLSAFEGISTSTALYWDTAVNAVTLTASASTIALTGVTIWAPAQNCKMVTYNSGTGVVNYTTGNALIVIL